MNKRPRREYIKKPSRYETTASSDDEEAIRHQKKTEKISIIDDINDIRDHISEYDTQKLHEKESNNSNSEVIQATSVTLCPTVTTHLSYTDSTIPLTSSVIMPSLNNCAPTSSSMLLLSNSPTQQFAQSTIFQHEPVCDARPHFLQSFPLQSESNSSVLPTNQCLVSLRNQNLNETYVTSTLTNAASTSTFQFSSPVYTSSMSQLPETSVITSSSSIISAIGRTSQHSLRNERSSSNLQPLSDFPSSSSSLTRKSQPSLTLLSAPATHHNMNFNAYSNNTYTSNPNLNQNMIPPHGNTDLINVIKTQVTECMNNAMTEIRMINQRSNQRVNKRPIKPKVIPFETIEEVLEFNQSNDAKYIQMVQYLASIGGRNIRDVIYLAFKEIFTPNSASLFTWTGKDNNNRSTKEKLSDLRVIDALHDAASTHFELTLSEFKFYVSEALRSAKQRHRHQQRMNTREQHNII